VGGQEIGPRVSETRAQSLSQSDLVGRGAARGKINRDEGLQLLREILRESTFHFQPYFLAESFAQSRTASSHLILCFMRGDSYWYLTRSDIA